MKFNPDIHHRCSIRLKDYDYTGNGAYFLTLCTFDRCCYFDQFPQLRNIVEHQWHNIPEKFANVFLDKYVVMPNHFHGILVVDNSWVSSDGYSDASNQNHKIIHLGDIVGAFKSLCVNSWLKMIKAENINARGKFWQDNYYEHVIRNDDEMNRIRRYIEDNPAQWELDRENPATKCRLKKQSEKWMV